MTASHICNKQFIALACSVCTVKYRTPDFLLRTTKLPQSENYLFEYNFTVQTSRSVNNPVLLALICDVVYLSWTCIDICFL